MCIYIFYTFEVRVIVRAKELRLISCVFEFRYPFMGWADKSCRSLANKSEKMVGTTLKMAENGKGSPMVVSIVNPLISLDEGIVSSI